MEVLYKPAGDPIHTAARGNDIGALLDMLDARVDVNIAGESDGMTPLLCSGQNGHIEATMLLLERKAEVDNEGQTLRRPLQTAIAANDSAMAEVLLKANADPNKADKFSG